jgi:hypothetical protein
MFVAHKLSQISLNAIPLLPAFLNPRAHSSHRVYGSPLSTKSTGDNFWIIGPKCNELTADRFRHFKLRGRTTNEHNKPTCRGIQEMPAATIMTKNVQRLELRGLHKGTDRSTAAFLLEHGRGTNQILHNTLGRFPVRGINTVSKYGKAPSHTHDIGLLREFG